MDFGSLIPIAGMLTGCFMFALIMFPYLMRQYHKLVMERDRLKHQQSSDGSLAEQKVQRLTERLEHLEAILCRVDSEMNSQLEKSLRLRVTPSQAFEAALPSPTAILNVAGSLDSRYQILKELGRGGMGIVFQAYDKQLKEQVAIKILSPLLSADPEALERLKREVSSARRVTHQNVIRIHDLSELGGLHFVSMEFFEGTQLKEFIRQNRPLSQMQVFLIAAQLCDGLEAAHAQGVIHRDLKSQNVILNAANQVKIIDFGLARSAQQQEMTATGLILGTPEYMAPEQVSGKKVDERADIYSLGIILYELFTGRVPFSGESPISVGFQQIKDAPAKPTLLNAQIPVEVETVILKALEKDPERRYRSVAELRRALENAQRAQPSAALPAQEQGVSRIKEYGKD